MIPSDNAPYFTPPWEDPTWQAEAHAWIRAELARRGIAVSGPIEQPHIRPWSTVMRVPAGPDVVYFKAIMPVLGYEPPVTAWLAARRPDCIPQPLAVDVSRRWMLLPDAGPRLRSLLQAHPDPTHWERIFPLYAELQQQTAPQADALLALGICDYRPAALAARYDDLVSRREVLVLDASVIPPEDNLTEADYLRAQTLQPRVVAIAEELAAYGLPHTIHHDDFHDGNVFVRDGRYMLADWGESAVAHPFCTMTVALRSIAYRFGWEADAPQLAHLRDCYLAAWTAYAPLPDLRRVADLADRLGRLCRAFSWYAAVYSLPHDLRSDNPASVSGWVQEFLLSEPA